MLVNNLKELNRNLQEGNVYSQKITIAGLKKRLGTDNLLATLIYMGTMKSLHGRLKKELRLETTKEFEELVKKDFS
jgi:hypothetical protein